MKLPLILGFVAATSAMPLSSLKAQPTPQPAPTQGKEENPPAKSDKPATAPLPIKWETSFMEALAKARETQKPVMVNFYADWCSICRAMDKIVYTNTKVMAEASNFVSVRVNADKQKDIAARYGIRIMPTIAWMDSNGKILYGMEGGAPASQFVPEMQTAHAIYQRHLAAEASKNQPERAK